ncbi:MAG: hypothetical protein ABUS56_13675 [Acidobacteriota bacterium]
MNINRHVERLVVLATALAVVLGAGRCSSTSTPTTLAPTPPVAPSVALASVSLSQGSVVGGNPVTGTVTLTAAAPTGGAAVTLSGADPLSVAASVLVPAGAAVASFGVSTRAVGATMAGTVIASYGGVSSSAAISVTRPTVATASFGVTGPTESDTCTIADGGNTLDCTFNGSTSTAPGTIVAWDWSYGVAGTFAQTTSGPVLTLPAVTCSLLPPPPLPTGVLWFTIVVTLKIHDDLGNVSAVLTQNGARVLPQGACGY